jgi:signal transduction histidine kinase
MTSHAAERARITRILLVEDDPDDAEIVRASLAGARWGGYEVACARRWAEAEPLLAAGRFDLLLLDLSLPDACGLQVLERAQRAAPHLPILIMTGLDDEATAMRALEMGAQDYLVKGAPYENALLRTVRSAIQRHRILEELEQTRRRQLELKDHFLSHVSHELRTPLTAVVQFVSLVADGLAGDLEREQEEYLSLALRNAAQLERMIGDLMDATRAEAGRLSVEPRPLALGEIVWETVQGFSAAAGEKRIVLSAVVPDDLPLALADESRVRQVLSNLIENALKFTDEGGVVTVRRAEPQEDDEALLVTVEDSGCGLAPEACERVFERMHQEESATPASRRGLGLGLWICRELVARHRGRIWVESEPGRGSAFRFTLPVFSLARLLEPILLDQGHLRESCATIRVDVTSSESALGSPLPEAVLDAVHAVLEGSVMRDLDRVLPRLGPRDQGESFFVVAAAGAEGMSALVRRIRRQLGRSPALRAPNLRIRVRGSVHQIKSEGDEADVHEGVRGVAREVSAWIEDESLWRGASDGE